MTPCMKAAAQFIQAEIGGPGHTKYNTPVPSLLLGAFLVDNHIVLGVGTCGWVTEHHQKFIGVSREYI